VSKTALLGLTKALSVELGPDGIRVNGIAPGLIKTKLSRGVCLVGMTLGKVGRGEGNEPVGELKYFFHHVMFVCVHLYLLLVVHCIGVATSK